MNGRASKRKGSAGEREVEKLLKDNGIDAKRTGYLQVELEGIPDVTLTKYPDVHIEAKRVERSQFYQWFEQAKKDAPDKLKLVFNRRNSKKWMVFMEAEEFLPMLKLYLEEKELLEEIFGPDKDAN